MFIKTYSLLLLLNLFYQNHYIKSQLSRFLSYIKSEEYDIIRLTEIILTFE